MSGIVAIFNRDGRPIEAADVTTMLRARPERGPDGERLVTAGAVALGHRLFRLLPEDEVGAQPLALDDLLLSADCRLDNRPELARSLGLEAQQIATISDAELILLAYRAWGERCPERLLGDFAFILWDGTRRQLFAARDALGVNDLCYYIDERRCLLASEVCHILAHPAVRARVNDDLIAVLLAGLTGKQEETYFHDIYYLPPAHALRVTEESVATWRYWDVEPATLRYRDERQYAERYRELLAEAVRCRLRSVGPVGISLSGGLDSSSLAALAAPMLPAATGQARLKSYSYAFDELESCDERAYIRPVVDRYGLDPTYINGDDRWIFKDMAEWPVSRDYVITDVFAGLPASVQSAAGAAGIRLLLAGYFGDTLMTGQHYWALDMARHGRFGRLARTTRANWGAFNWRDSFIEFGLRRLIPPSAAGFYRRIRPRQADAVAPGIHPDLLRRTNLADRLSPAPQQGRTPPGFRQRYDTLFVSSFSQSAAVRYQYNQCGMEVLEPYRDRRLVEFVLAVPAYVLGQPGNYRRLHREAMTGLLPEEVRLRPRRTTFAPLIEKGLERERAAIRRLMTKPLVVERGYIRGDWLQTQLDGEIENLVDRSLLLRSICLELWLQRYWT